MKKLDYEVVFTNGISQITANNVPAIDEKSAIREAKKSLRDLLEGNTLHGRPWHVKRCEVELTEDEIIAEATRNHANNLYL